MSKQLACQMEQDCKESITHIDDHGFIYCAEHGRDRQWSNRCRKLRDHEINRLRRAETIKY